MTPANRNDPQLVPQGRRSRSGSVLRPIAWASVPIWSIGFLSFVPFLGYALIQRRRRDWAVFAVYLAATVGLIAAVTTVRSNSGGSRAVGGFLVVLAGGAAIHAAILFRSGNAPAAPVLAAPPGTRQHNKDAVAEAKDRIERRKEARRLAETDPALARDLHIGRPDVPRDYDDGGLVDVNHVPEAVLAGQLGMTPHEVSAVMSARSQLGRFENADELCAYTDLSPDRVDELRDLMIFD